MIDTISILLIIAYIVTLLMAAVVAEIRWGRPGKIKNEKQETDFLKEFLEEHREEIAEEMMKNMHDNIFEIADQSPPSKEQTITEISMDWREQTMRRFMKVD